MEDPKVVFEASPSPSARSTSRIRSTLFYCLLSIACCAFPPISPAEESVTLPLNGYYHPGKYMPVHVVMQPMAPGEGNVRLFAGAGSVWTYVRLDGGRVDVTVPWMIVDARAQQLSWHVSPRPHSVDVAAALRPLGEHDRLVGWAGVDPVAATEAAQRLFPGDHLILMPLDPLQPISGSAAAWDTLDAVVLDPAAAELVGEPRFAGLIAEGVAFVVRADIPAPFPRWTWKLTGNWYVIQLHPAGPSAVVYNEAEYAPVSSWVQGWSTEMRHGVMLAGAGFSAVILLLALWHPRFSVALAVIVSLFFLGGFEYFRDHHRPGQTVGGKIRIVTPTITQDDDWAYQSSHQTTYSNIRWVDTTRIMFSSAAQLDRLDARVVCFANGDPDYLFFNLPANVKVALLSRRCGPQAPTIAPTPATTTPLIDLAKNLYLRAGDEIIGEFPSAPLIGEAYAPIKQWPALVIKRGDEK